MTAVRSGLLAGKTAVITGGAGRRGIGYATARLFAEHGCRCALLDLPAAAPAAAAAALPAANGGGHVGLVCDVADAGVVSVFNAAAAALGGVNILVNNAGFSQPLKLEEITDADYDAIMDVHLRACLRLSQAAAAKMRRSGGGVIVNLSSISAVRGGGIFGGPHYSAAKAGVIGLTRALARELAADGIRVNAVAPSLISTDIFGDKLGAERMRDIAADIPMGRVGAPADVAGVVLFLASDLAAYVTGEVINVTGGSHIG